MTNAQKIMANWELYKIHTQKQHEIIINEMQKTINDQAKLIAHLKNQKMNSQNIWEAMKALLEVANRYD